MQVGKEEVVAMLRSQGEHDRAQKAVCALPPRVDTEADAGLLHAFEINTRDLANRSGDSTPRTTKS